MIDISADKGKLMRRKRMKSNLVSSGTMRSRRTIDQSFILRAEPRSDWHALRTLPAHPVGDNQAGQGEGGEHRGDDADSERHRETAHRPSADVEQHGGCDEGGDVGVENGGKSAGETGVDRVGRRAAAARLFAGAVR